MKAARSPAPARSRDPSRQRDGALVAKNGQGYPGVTGGLSNRRPACTQTSERDLGTMHALPKRRARPPDSARLQLVDPCLRRPKLRLDSANVDLSSNLFSQRGEKLRRKRLAI